MQKPAHLRITDRFGVEKTHPISKPVFTIGRKPVNDLQLIFGNVSRQHCEIAYETGDYYLVDKGSTTGTFLNGKRIERSPLRHLDVISLGGGDECQIKFVESTSSVVAASAPAARAETRPADTRANVAASEELQKLARYVEVHQAFKFSLDPDDVLCLIVDAAVETTGAERGLLMLRNGDGELEFKVARDRERRHIQSDHFSLSQSVVDEAFRRGRTVILNDAGDESAFVAGASVMNLSLRTVICVPMRRFRMSERMDATLISAPEVIGIIYVDSHSVTGALSRTSLAILESLAFEASKSLENVRLMHEEQEKQRLEREFTLAREVQVELLPNSFCQPDYFEVAAHSVPCRYVGGDFYDLTMLEDGRAVITLADVSGKGIAAALLASMAQGVVQAQINLGLPLAEIIGSLNRVVVQKSSANRFITLFCAILDREGHLVYVNAGHNPPILARSGAPVETLGTGSLMVGAFDFAEYRATEVQLREGDVLVAFSDGVTEAANAAGEMFGDERLERLVETSVGLSAEQIKNRIVEEVLAFTRGLPQGDDITLVAVKVRKAARVG